MNKESVGIILVAYVVTLALLGIVTWLLTLIDTFYCFIGLCLISVDSIIFVTILSIEKNSYYRHSISMCLITKLFEELDKDVSEVEKAENEGNK